MPEFAPSTGGAALVNDIKKSPHKAGMEVIVGLFDKLFKKRPDLDPVKKERQAAAPPPAPEVKKRTSWIDELADPDSPVHEKLKKLPEPPKEKTEPAQRIEVAVTVRHEYKKAEPIGELSHLEFGKPAGALGCFLNYEPRVLSEPTERQLAYLKDLGVFIPDGITKDDASCMISRATGEDDLESPGPELVALAVGLGVRFSAFIGAAGLLRQIVGQTGERDRAALFGYAVRQSLQGSGLGNMLEDPAVGSFYDFADQVAADPALLRSLNGREPVDYIHPHKGTAIYKAAAVLFSGGGA